MQEDNSMVQKILIDLENIISSDDDLKQFDIVPITENFKNKSPVLYEEHNVALEMWCVKHVYSYTHSYLLKIRKHLKRNLRQCDVDKANRSLIGAVLIQPDVTTFWNMRRDLIEMNLIKSDKELLVTKLVLSYKPKSNEAFMHRKWIIRRSLENINNNVETLIEKEFLVAKMACQRAVNNYHAWSYKIWLIETIPNASFKSLIIRREFISSLDHVFLNVSEHSGFHYRQRLLTFLERNVAASDMFFIDFKQFVTDRLHINSESLIVHLLGENVSKLGDSSICILCVILFELLYTCAQLNRSYPGHESIWCHRRFVLHALLSELHRCFDFEWTRDIKIRSSDGNRNIVEAASSDEDFDMRENGEKHPKMFKAEPRLIEDTNLYKFVIRTETDFIRENTASTNSVQSNLARRHEKWLKHILQVNVYV